MKPKVTSLTMWILMSFICLQGCFVLSLDKRIWSATDKTDDPAEVKGPAPSLPSYYINFKGNEKIFPLPFVFISWQTKYYGLYFAFSSKNYSYNPIDSIQYRLLTVNDSAIHQGSYTKPLPFRRISTAGDTNSYYIAITETKYHLRLQKNNLGDDIKINLTLYSKDSLGFPLTYKYFAILTRSQKKRFNFEPIN